MSRPAAAPRSARHRRSLSAIFLVPVLIALFSLIGLVSALTGDGLRDVLSWAGLAVPLLAIAWAWLRRRQ